MEPARVQNDLLRGLPPEALELMAPHLRSRTFASGHVLFEPGDHVHSVYFPQSGLISLMTLMSSGVGIENTNRGMDGGIGYVEACGSQMMVSRVIVQIDCEALWLPASVYRNVYDRSVEVRRAIHRRIELLLAEARQLVACHALHSAEQRLAKLLLEVSDRTLLRDIPLTQDFMAGMIGVGRTTVTHVAGLLERAGAIEHTRGRVLIVRRQVLELNACECFEALKNIRQRVLGGDVGC